MKEEMGTSKEENTAIDLEQYRRLVRVHIDMVIASNFNYTNKKIFLLLLQFSLCL